MGNTEQLDNIASKVDAVGRQVEDVSEKMDRVWIAQQGNAALGAPGLMNRVDVLEEKIDGIKTQQEVWNTQMRLMALLFGGGSLGGFVALIWTLIQVFSGS